MEQAALRQVRREAMQRRLSFLVSTAEDAVYELWQGELDYAAAERLTLEVRTVQAEIRTLRTKLLLGEAVTF